MMNNTIQRCGLLSLFIHRPDTNKSVKCNEIVRGVILKEDLTHFFEVLK
jgi:hypothetical protein